MARSPENQKKNRAALRALGHRNIAAAIAEIKEGIPNFHKKNRYPTIFGIRPSLAALLLHVRKVNRLQFDSEIGYVSRNQRVRAARLSHGGDFIATSTSHREHSGAW